MKALYQKRLALLNLRNSAKQTYDGLKSLYGESDPNVIKSKEVVTSIEAEIKSITQTLTEHGVKHASDCPHQEMRELVYDYGTRYECVSCGFVTSDLPINSKIKETIIY